MENENLILDLDVSTKKTVSIYGLLDPEKNTLRYVGKTVNPKRRLSRHISERFIHDSYKDRWIRKLLDKGIKPELIIIDEVPYDEWCFWEIHYISYFKMLGSKLTNSTNGGDQPPSTKGRKHTKESRKKMSETKKGKDIPWLNNGPRTEEHCVNLSKSCKGRISPNKGNKYSEEYKNKLSIAHIGLFSGENHPMYGKTHTQETKKKLSKHFSKVIIQFSKGGELIKEWESIKIATETLNINNISACCIGKNKTAGGFIWKHKN